MDFISRDRLIALRAHYPIGCRVQLDEMDDPQAPPIGTFGTVIGVDDSGSIMVNWDTGSSLHVLFGVDRCHRVKEPERLPDVTYEVVFQSKEGFPPEERYIYTDIGDAEEHFNLFDSADSEELYRSITLYEHNWRTREETVLRVLHFS